MAWIAALASAGVELREVHGDTVLLGHEGQAQQFLLRRRSRSPRPSEIRSPAASATLLVAPCVSAGAQRRLGDLGWSWVTDTGQVHLRFGDGVVDFDPSAATVDVPAGERRMRVRGVGGFAVLRRLLEAPEDATVRQRDLALGTGLTQARVSQLLAALRRDDIVDGSRAAWRVADRDRAFDAWLRGYPGPGGTVTHWTSLDDMWTTTLALLDILPAGTVASGDAGADLLAPWRRPEHAVLYAPHLPDLSRSGLVQVASTDRPTVSVCVPADRTVWPVAPTARAFRNRPVLIADPLQVLWDLARETGVDADQAVDRLRTWIRHHDLSAAGKVP